MISFKGNQGSADTAEGTVSEVARGLADRLGTPESQRALSVSLAKAADAAQARGEFDHAVRAYRLKLEIARALADRLGTPESLRDVAVGLYNLARLALAKGDRDDATVHLTALEAWADGMPERERAEVAPVIAALRSQLDSDD